MDKMVDFMIKTTLFAFAMFIVAGLMKATILLVF